MGKDHDTDVAVKAVVRIRDTLMHSERLKITTKNNTEKDFEFAHFGDVDNTLIEGQEQIQDFFSMLLAHPEAKKDVLGTFAQEIHSSLRSA